MRNIVHVNRQIIDSNRKYNRNDEPIIVRNYKKRQNTRTVEILDKDGNVVARIGQARKQLDCGARCYAVVGDNIRLSNAYIDDLERSKQPKDYRRSKRNSAKIPRYYSLKSSGSKRNLI